MKTLPRLLLGALSIVLAVIAPPPDVHADKRLGIIMTGDIPYYGAMHEAFVAEINRQTAGGEKIEIILQRPFPDPISWSNAARKLIAFDVDLIVTYGSPATQAVIHEKSRIPLVYAGVYDPAQAVLSSKNVKGCGIKIPLSSILRYFKGLKPVSTLGIVFSSIEEDTVRQYETMRELAAQQEIAADKIDIRSRGDLEKLKSKKWDAVFITGSSLAHLWLNDIITILRKEQIPTADIFPDSSEIGVLMTLSQPSQPHGQTAAEMAAQILRGDKGIRVAAQTFRDTELVFNLLEARHLGITFPINLVTEATRVIK